MAVDSDRNNGIRNLRNLEGKPNVILLDDAFQHRKVKARFNILLTTYSSIYTDDMVLPTGNLREPKSGAKRADVIVVTKCPYNLEVNTQNEIIKKIKPENDQHVFFSHITYSNAVFSSNTSIELKTLPNFTLVTGIANAKPLVDFLATYNLNFNHLNYSDHHDFSQQDILELQKHELIITTEKDYMRLKKYDILRPKLYYLPITIGLNDTQVFNKLIKDVVTPI